MRYYHFVRGWTANQRLKGLQWLDLVRAYTYDHLDLTLNRAEGVFGIAALKNLLEEGFEAVGFERHDYIGGLWKWTKNPSQTSVLNSTIANISKQRNSYHDFPFPDGLKILPLGLACSRKPHRCTKLSNRRSDMPVHQRLLR